MAFKDDIKTGLSSLSTSKKALITEAFGEIFSEVDGVLWTDRTADEKLDFVAQQMINNLKTTVEATLQDKDMRDATPRVLDILND